MTPAKEKKAARGGRESLMAREFAPPRVRSHFWTRSGHFCERSPREARHAARYLELVPDFKLNSAYIPTADQPKAIAGLAEGLGKGERFQSLLGATGTGKAFTMPAVIAEPQRPALVSAHNKPLAAQLCSEFREFFPENEVNYFVSYYDYS